MTEQPISPPQAQTQRLRELALLFLRLGTTAFGGPIAHIAMMEDEIVGRRQWMSREKLLDLLGMTNLIPGPNSTELAIHIGYERAGWPGLAIAGTCFILPAMVIVWGLAIVYAQTQSLPQFGALLYGIKPVMIVIVLQAIWKLGRKAVRDLPTAMVALAVLGCYLLGINEIILLVLAGLGVMVVKGGRLGGNSGMQAAFVLPVLWGQATVPPPSVKWLNLFWIFVKIGCVLYGSGYVLLVFLQRELVERTGWLSSQQLLDAIAIGQFTPGPVFTTATFIGYLLAGHMGALAATIGIFLPAFVLVALVNPWASKLRQSKTWSGFLDGVNAASLGLMGSVTWQLSQTALVDGLAGAIAVVSAIALFRFQVNSTWLVLAGGCVGLLASWLR